MSRRDLHAAFVEEFGRPEVTRDNIKALCSRKRWNTGRTGCFAKGSVPANKGRKGWYPPGCEKGWFTKGQRRGAAVELYKPVGTERLSKEGYLERKIHDGLPLQSRWRAVHLIEWEARHGAVPAGYCLRCLSTNIADTDPGNWELISRAVNLRLNGRHTLAYAAAEPEIRPLVLAAAKVSDRARNLARART